MLSRIAALGFISQATAQATTEFTGSLTSGKSFNAENSCKDCLLGGTHTYCVNTPWFYFQFAAEGTAVGTCIDGAVADGIYDKDPLYKCSSYTDEGTAEYYKLRLDDDEIICHNKNGVEQADCSELNTCHYVDSNGDEQVATCDTCYNDAGQTDADCGTGYTMSIPNVTQKSLSPKQYKQGFNDNNGLAYALAACPTKSQVCGSKKFFRFGENYFDVEGNPVSAVDTEDVMIAADTMSTADTCTYIIRSKCDIPGFAIKGDTTMTDSDIGISIIEWRDDFITHADDRESFISPAYLVDLGGQLPPKLSTTWIEKDDSSALPGELGNWRNDTSVSEYSGQWVMKQMSSFRTRYEEFKPLKDEYDLAKNSYNAALRISQLGNNLQIMSYVSWILPTSATPFETTANAFVKPEYPFMPYSPPEYDGPDFSVWNTLAEAEIRQVEQCVGIVCNSHAKTFYPRGPKEGYGRPMSYIYTFPTVAEADANRLYGHRSFGVFGTADTADTSDGGTVDLFNPMGVRLGNEDPATCNPSYMAITVFPKGDDDSMLSGMLSMKLLDTTEGQETKRPYRGNAATPPNKQWDDALKLAASAAAAATLITTMI